MSKQYIEIFYTFFKFNSKNIDIDATRFNDEYIIIWLALRLIISSKLKKINSKKPIFPGDNWTIFAKNEAEFINKDPTKFSNWNIESIKKQVWDIPNETETKIQNV